MKLRIKQKNGKLQAISEDEKYKFESFIYEDTAKFITRIGDILTAEGHKVEFIVNSEIEPAFIQVIKDLLAVAEQTKIDLNQRGLSNGVFAMQVDETIKQSKKYLDIINQ